MSTTYLDSTAYFPRLDRGTQVSNTAAHSRTQKRRLFTTLTNCLLILCLFPNILCAQSVSEAERTLQQLNHKIAILQKDVSQTHTQQTQSQRELSTTEQQIRKNEKTLQTIMKKIPLKKEQIAELQRQIAESQVKFTGLQALLMKQIQARYKQQPNQPLSWFLTHPQKAEVDTLLTYYQYVIHTHEDILQQLKIAQASLQNQQAALQHEVEALHRLQAQAQLEHQQLQGHKTRHQTLLYSLQQQLLSQENTLNQYQRNRDNLSQILRKLSRESVIQTRHSMTTMKRKLPYPVNVETSHIHKLHQGVLLDSPEGSPVHVVYPGKIVFSEWLNGYGLLVIVDHGWGLMTLYANNLAATKRVGDIVNQGEQIATVGHGGISKQSGLYFEVRKHGKAISPLDWLGKV